MNKNSKRLKDILSRVIDGPMPSALIGIADGANGKIEVIARLAYIAGIKRAIDIIEKEEDDDPQAKNT
jgi:hypothetical protein